MSRALPYCAFLPSVKISLPETGVGGAPIQMMDPPDLRLLWSEVEWPFRPEQVQKYAVEFHGVVHHIFRQAAVVPFRLLSAFDDMPALRGFIADHAAEFTADLMRLRDVVQMECVIYPAPATPKVEAASGTAYLREKAEKQRMIELQVNEVRTALDGLAREVRVREGKNGTRIFVLVERGREKEFRPAVEQVTTPEQLSRRVSGPWPAAEFLSETVLSPKSP